MGKFGAGGGWRRERELISASALLCYYQGEERCQNEVVLQSTNTGQRAVAKQTCGHSAPRSSYDDQQQLVLL